MGHKYGDSPQFYNAVEAMDKRVGLIWKAIRYRRQHFNEDWLLIITTDHGREPATGKGHGGQSDRERGSWIFTNAKTRNAEFHAPYASATDIMPGIARFMHIDIPEATAFEIDGLPFIGPLSFNQAQFSLNNHLLRASWKPLTKKGKIKIWLSTTNGVKTGQKDTYTLLDEVPVSKQSVQVSLAKFPSAFYKVVLQGEHNTANAWLTEK